jgi:hypothetical protein
VVPGVLARRPAVARTRRLPAHAAADAGGAGTPRLGCRIRPERNNFYRLQRVLQILVQSGGVPLAQQDVPSDQPLEHDYRCGLAACLPGGAARLLA